MPVLTRQPRFDTNRQFSGMSATVWYE